MHHHRLVLNGPPRAVARLADDLCAAGAVAVAPDGGGGAAAPSRLVWATPSPVAVEALCARHGAVVVGVERFETLGAELERLVVQGREATVLERRRLVPSLEEDEEDASGLGLVGLCIDEGGTPLPADAVRAAARTVAAVPAPCGATGLSCSLDDALLLGPALGRVCAAAGEPFAEDAPSAGALDALRGLAAVALSVAAASGGSVCAAEFEHERQLRLTRAALAAGAEPLWARPGEADWPEWLMYVLMGAAEVIESCGACLHGAGEVGASVHAEHYATVEEELDRAACGLVGVVVQVLVLFG